MENLFRITGSNREHRLVFQVTPSERPPLPGELARVRPGLQEELRAAKIHMDRIIAGLTSPGAVAVRTQLSTLRDRIFSENPDQQSRANAERLIDNFSQELNTHSANIPAGLDALDLRLRLQRIVGGLRSERIGYEPAIDAAGNAVDTITNTAQSPLLASPRNQAVTATAATFLGFLGTWFSNAEKHPYLNKMFLWIKWLGVGALGLVGARGLYTMISQEQAAPNPPRP